MGGYLILCSCLAGILDHSLNVVKGGMEGGLSGTLCIQNARVNYLVIYVCLSRRQLVCRRRVVVLVMRLLNCGNDNILL